MQKDDMTTSVPNAPATRDLALQPVTEDNGSLSPWWIRAIVMMLGFAGLILITTLSYCNAPPIPAQAVNGQDALVFSADGIGKGRALFSAPWPSRVFGPGYHFVNSDTPGSHGFELPRSLRWAVPRSSVHMRPR